MDKLRTLFEKLKAKSELTDVINFNSYELEELELNVVMVLAAVVEGKTGKTLTQLAQECHQFVNEHCNYLNEIDLLDYEELIR